MGATFEDLWLISGIAGLVGLLLGSFLNVCTFRWPTDQSVVRPPSHCPGCGKGIHWYDNVPVVSYLMLRGKCRSCGVGISPQYPMVELATGLIWAGSFMQNGPSIEGLRGALFLTILLGIAITDARFYIIPDQFSLGGGLLGLTLAPFAGGLTLLEALLGAAVGFGILFLVAKVGTWLFKKDAMGGGDLKMMAMVGAFLGVPGVLLTIFLGALLGSVVFGPISWKTGKLVPFGIFLAVGA
ncbi:MAG: prepilin peptidase, partial [Gemmatimonadetes bacterium]|nr:prepilin peptidase [Gemmatimonadota bacterium]